MQKKKIKMHYSQQHDGGEYTREYYLVAAHVYIDVR